MALVAALLHVVFHAVFKGSLFLSASSVHQAAGSTDLDGLGGLLQRMPVSGPIFLVGGLAIAALPPFCGFVSEWLLLQSMLHGLPSNNVAIAVAMPIGVGVLALTGGLTAFTFTKAIGVGLLGLPRTEHAERAREVRRPMWLGAGLLAVLCLVFGVAPFLVIPSVLNTAGAIPGLHLAGAFARGWNVALPGVPGMLAPGLVAIALAGFGGLVTLGRRHVQRGPVRLTEAWGCGRELQTARMEYTATSFAEPLGRVFADVLRPDHDVEVTHVAESRYFAEASDLPHDAATTASSARSTARPTVLDRWGAVGPSRPERQCAPLPGVRLRRTRRRSGGTRMTPTSLTLGGVDLVAPARRWSSLGGPLLLGLMAKVRARAEGRLGAPIRQPLRDLRKLLGKRAHPRRALERGLRARAVRARRHARSWPPIAPLVHDDAGARQSADLFVVVFLLLMGSVALALAGPRCRAPPSGAWDRAGR